MSDLDDLMNAEPPFPPGDIDKLILHYRQRRAQIASGVKPKKEEGPKEKLDVAELMSGIGLKPAAPKKTILRRI